MRSGVRTVGGVANEFDVTLPDGRTLHGYDTGAPGEGHLPVVWFHGTPNIGTPPAPLFAAADRLGIRWVAYDRPGYGGSTPVPDRTIASAASDVALLADAVGVEQFAVMGHSGGSPHALACAALLTDRVLAAVAVSGLAPFDAEGLDWFAGMGPGGVASLRAAAAGRAAKEQHEAAADIGEPDFTAADVAALSGEWSWFMQVVGPAVARGPAPLIDDDLAYVNPWGFDPASVTAPLLLVHGEDDLMVPCSHSRWLAAHCPTAELRLVPGEGHVSVLSAAPDALAWLCDAAAAAS